MKNSETSFPEVWSFTPVDSKFHLRLYARFFREMSAKLFREKVPPESTPNFSVKVSPDSKPSFPEKVYPSLSLAFMLLFSLSPQQDYACLYARVFLEMSAKVFRQSSSRVYS